MFRFIIDIVHINAIFKEQFAYGIAFRNRLFGKHIVRNNGRLYNFGLA